MTAGEPLGTAAEEAARLVESLHGWWREREAAPPAAEHAAEHAAGPAAHADHTASGACRHCPWCRAVSAAQQVRPEVVQHLLGAAESFVAALRELSRPPADAPAHPPPASPAGAAGTGLRTVTIPVRSDDELDRAGHRPDDHGAAQHAADEEDH